MLSLTIANYMLRNKIAGLPLINRAFLYFYDIYKTRESGLGTITEIIDLDLYDAVFDVGGGLGFFSTYVFKRVRPNVSIYSFEPDSLNNSLFKKRLKNMGNPINIKLIESAVSNSNSKAKLAINKDHFGDHRLEIDNTEIAEVTGPRLEVDTVSLSNFIKSLTSKPKKILVKIDVQGHEPAVINGLKDISSTGLYIDVLLEFSPSHLDAQGFDPGLFLKNLKSNSSECLFRNESGKFIDCSYFNHSLSDYTDIWCKNLVINNYMV